MVAIKHVSRYMELCPLTGCTTATVMKTFYDDVILRFGKPWTLKVNRSNYLILDTMKSVAKLFE